MKKLFHIGMICLTALAIGALVCCTEKDGNDNTSGSNVVTNNDNGGNNGGDGGDNGGGNGGDNGGDNGGNNGGNVNDVWVDLGLPSGTKWKNANEVNAADAENDFYTYDEAVAAFGDALPTKGQLEELKDNCQWTWNGSGYTVTGPNGHSIVLPAAGYRYCNGGVYNVGSCGFYWSSAPNGLEYAWSLHFYSGSVYMYSSDRCRGFSVRLVQD